MSTPALLARFLTTHDAVKCEPMFSYCLHLVLSVLLLPTAGRLAGASGDIAALVEERTQVPMLWREDEPSLFMGDAGSLTCAHTDIAPISHLMPEITAGRLEKRGTRARCAHNLRARGSSSCAARGELLVDTQVCGSQ